MHHHLEIIMPPVADIEASIKQIMKPFDESGDDENEDGDTRYSFWDWYVIGGRWAGHKQEAMFDQEKLKAFHEELNKRGVTVSSFTAGKQTLQPESQIPMVDALWLEFFPDSVNKACPLFSHYNDQYSNSDGYPDIMKLSDIPQRLTASHVIVAGPHWGDDKEGLEAKYMLQNSIYNGVSFVKTAWDGKVRTVIEQHKELLKNAKPEYAAKHIPQDDWLVVTVDYHS